MEGVEAVEGGRSDWRESSQTVAQASQQTQTAARGAEQTQIAAHGAEQTQIAAQGVEQTQTAAQSAEQTQIAAESLVVPIWSNMVKNGQGVLIAVVGGYILAIGHRRTRNIIEGVLFAFVGTSLIALNLRYLREVFVHLRQLLVKMFIYFRHLFGEAEAEDDNADGGIEGVGDLLPIASQATQQTQIVIPLWSRIVSNTQGVLLAIFAGYLFAISILEGMFFAFVGVAILALNMRQISIYFTNLFREGFGIESAERGAEEGAASYICTMHGLSFDTFEELIEHAQQIHGGFSFCRNCEIIFEPGDDGSDHLELGHLIDTYAP